MPLSHIDICPFNLCFSHKKGGGEDIGNNIIKICKLVTFSEGQIDYNKIDVENYES